MILRATIANADLHKAVKLAQEAGISGTASQGFGFGVYGTEPVTILEFTTVDLEEIKRVESLMVKLLGTFGEQAAYLTRDGMEVSILWADGRKDELA